MRAHTHTCTHRQLWVQGREKVPVKKPCFPIVEIQTVLANVTCYLLKFDSRKKRKQTVKLSESNFCLVLVCRPVLYYFELFHPNEHFYIHILVIFAEAEAEMFGSSFFFLLFFPSKYVWQTELFALLTPSDGTLVLSALMKGVSTDSSITSFMHRKLPTMHSYLYSHFSGG